MNTKHTLPDQIGHNPCIHVADDVLPARDIATVLARPGGRRSRHRAQELRADDAATLASFIHAPLACAARTPPGSRLPALTQAVCA